MHGPDPGRPIQGAGRSLHAFRRRGGVPGLEQGPRPADGIAGLGPIEAVG